MFWRLRLDSITWNNFLWKQSHRLRKESSSLQGDADQIVSSFPSFQYLTKSRTASSPTAIAHIFDIIGETLHLHLYDCAEGFDGSWYKSFTFSPWNSDQQFSLDFELIKKKDPR